MRSVLAVLTTVLGRLAVLPRWQKRAIVFSVDLALLIAAVWIAYSLRMGVWILWNDAIAIFMLAAVPTMVASFVLTGVYKSIFRYAGSGMLGILTRAFLFYTAALATIFLLWSVHGVPRTLGLLQPLVYFVLIAGSRVSFRFMMVDLLGRGRFGGQVRQVLVYGAGQAGQALASSIRSDPSMRVVGFVDDDARLAGQKLDGTMVYHSEDLPSIAERHAITDVLIALPSTTRKRRRAIVNRLSALKLNVKTLPQAADIVGGKVSVSDLRAIEIEDLLGRDPVAPDQELLARTIADKAVMVTGAGGSIGSELCRQIVRAGARKLVLFEISEYSLYAIEQELSALAKETGKAISIVPALGSVLDGQRLAEVFALHAPQTVFHAAAYKHVPLVEANPLEGIRNNLLGTFETVNAAHIAKVEDFILISTDKAVRPTNVMGASKRAAEQVVMSFDAMSNGARYSMVRFGNVLGSSGSVVPLFRRQIERGGPITLTDRRIIRYFMTIPEAANLVIQAGGLAHGGEVFVLDMGKPVKIAALARTMIQLSGLSVRDENNPDGDIAIEEVGLRPGEKLYEELLIGDNPEKTRHPRILKAHETFLPWPELGRLLHRLKSTRDTAEALAILQAIVPELKHRRDDAPAPATLREAV